MSDGLSPRRRPRCHTDSLSHTVLQRRLRKSLTSQVAQSSDQLLGGQQFQLQSVQPNLSSTDSSDSLPLLTSLQQQKVQMLLQPDMYGSVPQQLNTISNQQYGGRINLAVSGKLPLHMQACLHRRPHPLTTSRRSSSPMHNSTCYDATHPLMCTTGRKDSDLLRFMHLFAQLPVQQWSCLA